MEFLFALWLWGPVATNKYDTVQYDWKAQTHQFETKELCESAAISLRTQRVVNPGRKDSSLVDNPYRCLPVAIKKK